MVNRYETEKQKKLRHELNMLLKWGGTDEEMITSLIIFVEELIGEIKE